MKNINWERAVEVFNLVSTTSVRIYFTMLIVAWTAWDYIYKNDIPDNDWLIFLATLAGVDMVQAAVKGVVNAKVRGQEVIANKETTVRNIELEHKKLSVQSNVIVTEPTIKIEEEKEKG